MSSENERETFPELDPLIYGGTRIPMNDESGEMFFLADNALLADEWEMIVGQPMQFGAELEPKVHLFLTFKGKLNNKEELAAFTVVLDYKGWLALTKTMRSRLTLVPLKFRGE